nr:Lipase domain containing protein [Haemonchus contortus]
MSATSSPLLLILQILFTFSRADFSPSFNAFLASTYGQEFADRMARRDLGAQGSFGGGDHKPGSRTKQQPVVLVHGITNTAGRFEEQRQYLLNHGWGNDEVYGTTYGDGGKTVAPLVDMKCDYVKQVRWFIQAVAEFTRRRVDVIAYSMGSPIARKAILGGRCQDTGEALGPPLSALIDTFVSVAACNIINGLSCNSQYLRNINSRQRYEGLFIYSIYSPQDDKVGYRTACGELASSITGADQEFQRSGNHDEVMANTIGLQSKLISTHSAAGQ